MKRKMVAVLCSIFIINLSSGVLASAELDTGTKDFNELRQANASTINPFDAKQRSYYFYNMIPDYFDAQDFLRGIYGNEEINKSPQFTLLTKSKQNFDKYYETNDIEYLELAIVYLQDHHVSVGNHATYHVHYRIASNERRAYVPSNFNKDKGDILEFHRSLIGMV